MKIKFDPGLNYKKTLQEAGYVPRKEATQITYDRIGFKSGLEVHQQLKTEEKLFCRCPAGKLNTDENYNAEILRHMRPTLSELGEYDGTALMEFKTRKEIIYRINNNTTCTYEIDDTPPFPINIQALKIAIQISLLCKLNIVGEVHVMRKQYLDGSIPTGFQRTAIIGIDGKIPLKDKEIEIVQLTIEEDSCREISDIGHTRTFKTDRLGIPLVEIVTNHDMKNPEEVKEVCSYIRFLTRSTSNVRIGSGTGRQDVNVSCAGGDRVEIKGVSHIKWIPELTHNEVFRQWSLLLIREKLLKNIPDIKNWKLYHKYIDINSNNFTFEKFKEVQKEGLCMAVLNLPQFKGILSHFTQPGKTFANEISDRLKIIACLGVPNIIHSEEFSPLISDKDLCTIKEMVNAKEDDAQILIWGEKRDVQTAIETVEERCQMAFQGVPRETRKSYPDGTTVFERVLPGPDRMYPDTDSPPVPLKEEYIIEAKQTLPMDVEDCFKQLKEWGIPQDTYVYILRNNLFPIMKKIIQKFDIKPCFVGVIFGHTLKFTEGQYNYKKIFEYKIIYDLLYYLQENKINFQLIKKLIPVLYANPKISFDEMLEKVNFKKIPESEIISKIADVKKQFVKKGKNKKYNLLCMRWIMGKLSNVARGNIDLSKLEKIVLENIK